MGLLAALAALAAVAVSLTVKEPGAGHGFISPQDLNKQLGVEADAEEERREGVETSDSHNMKSQRYFKGSDTIVHNDNGGLIDTVDEPVQPVTRLPVKGSVTSPDPSPSPEPTGPPADDTILSCVVTQTCRICTPEHECNFMARSTGNRSFFFGNYAACMANVMWDHRVCVSVCDCKLPTTSCHDMTGEVVNGCLPCDDHHPCTLPFDNFAACKTANSFSNEHCAKACKCQFVPEHLSPPPPPSK